MSDDKAICGREGWGLMCTRPRGHENPVDQCFAIKFRDDGHIWGTYMFQTALDDECKSWKLATRKNWTENWNWTKDWTQWPSDILEQRAPMTPSGTKIDRKGAIAHTRAKTERNNS